MKALLSSFARSGLVALGLLTGLSAAALAGPLPGPVTGVSDVSPTLPVQKAGGEWSGRHRNWEGRRHWRHNDWRPRRYYRPRHHYRDSGVFLGFGLGVPSYRYIEPGYRYVEPSYRYARPRYVPRRYQRVRMSQAHIDWCYSRYRSYRAYDNTFQPYNGLRRQCYSPYS